MLSFSLASNKIGMDLELLPTQYIHRTYLHASLGTHLSNNCSYFVVVVVLNYKGRDISTLKLIYEILLMC